MLTICDAINEVRSSVRKPKPKTFRLGLVNSIGEWGRQGDVYFTIIEKPKSLEPLKDFKGQLAEGETRGSRHCVDPKAVKAYANPATSVEKGPILFVEEDTEVTHPDHGHVILEKGICVEVSYQVSYKNQLLERVRD